MKCEEPSGWWASPWLGQMFRPPLRYLGHNLQSATKNFSINSSSGEERRAEDWRNGGKGWKERRGLDVHRQMWDGRLQAVTSFDHSAAQRLQRPEQASSAKLPGRGRRGGWNYWVPLARNERRSMGEGRRRNWWSPKWQGAHEGQRWQDAAGKARRTAKGGNRQKSQKTPHIAPRNNWKEAEDEARSIQNKQTHNSSLNPSNNACTATNTQCIHTHEHTMHMHTHEHTMHMHRYEHTMPAHPHCTQCMPMGCAQHAEMSCRGTHSWRRH